MTVREPISTVLGSSAASPTSSSSSSSSSEPTLLGCGPHAAARMLQLVGVAGLAQTEPDADATPQEVIGQLLELTTRLIPGADGAGVARLAPPDPPQTLSAVGDLPARCDGIQRETADGPSGEAGFGGTSLCVADLRREHRWARFTPIALDVGVRGMLLCPLRLRIRTAGVLTVYARTPGVFDATAESLLPVLCARAGIALAYADKIANLRRAIESRQIIGQAVGILMERHRITGEQAYATIVTASQRSHLKVRELAYRISESGQDPADAAETAPVA